MRKNDAAKRRTFRPNREMRLADIADRLGVSVMTLALALSMMPADSIAYALAESQGQIESSGDENAPDDESEKEKKKDGQDTPGDDGTDTPSTPSADGESEGEGGSEEGSKTDGSDKDGEASSEEGGETQGENDGEASKEDEKKDTDNDGSPAEGGSEKKGDTQPAAEQPKRFVRASFGEVKIDGEAAKVIDGKIFTNKDQVSSTIVIEGEGLVAGDISALGFSFDSERVSVGETRLEGARLVTPITLMQRDDTLDASSLKVSFAGEQLALEVPSIVFDKDAPEVSFAYVTAPDDAAEVAKTYGETSNNFDLTGGPLFIRVTVTDRAPIGEKPVVTWSEVSSATDITLASTKQDDGSYRAVAYLGPLAANDFIDGEGGFRLGSISLRLDDAAGNVETRLSGVFTSNGTDAAKKADAYRVYNKTVSSVVSKKSFGLLALPAAGLQNNVTLIGGTTIDGVECYGTILVGQDQEVKAAPTIRVQANDNTDLEGWTISLEDPDGGSMDVDATGDMNESGEWTVAIDDPEALDEGVVYSITQVSAYESGVTIPVTATPAGTQNFLVDYSAPEVSVSLSPTKRGTSGGVDYYDPGVDTKGGNNPVTATITVVDDHWDPTNCGVVTIEKDDDTITTAAADWTEVTGTNTPTYTTTIDFTEDGEHSLTVSGVKDRLNNKADEYELSTFVIDTVAPVVEVSFDVPATNNFQNKDFFDDDVTATVSVTDDNFDTGSTITTPQGGTFTPTWSTKDNKTYTAEVEFGESTGIAAPSDLQVDAHDLVYTVSQSPKDAVALKHQTTFDYRDEQTEVEDATGTATGFIVDKTAPTIKRVEVDTEPVSSGLGNEQGDPIFFYNRATSMTFFLSDVNGIAGVEVSDPEGQYEVSRQSAGIPAGITEGSFTIELVDGAQSDYESEFERDIEVKIIDLAGNWRVWTIGRMGQVKDVNGSDASNVSINDDGVFPVALIKDTTAPQISFSGVTPGAYSNQTVTVTTSINELNFSYLKRFDPERIVVYVTKYEGNAGRAKSTSVVPASLFTGSGANWSYDSLFGDDGHYVLEAHFKDFATNESNVAQLGEFTVDKTAPVIDSIVFDNNDARNDKYYKAGRTATITITEHNWDPSRIIIDTNGVIGSWSDNGDVHVITVSFLADGDYHLTVSGTDLAGNALAPQTVPEFTVDQTAPTIEFANVQNMTAYGDVIAPTILYRDEKNFDASAIEWTLTGNRWGAKTYATSTNPAGTGADVVFADFQRTVEVDDIYTLHAHMTDLAGNEAEADITFSVNRFGSNFIVLDAERYRGTDGVAYLTEPSVVRVQEINVCGAPSAQHGAAITHGLETDNLKQVGSGAKAGEFTISESKESYGWASYIYSVPAANFDEDGQYHVVVSSTDYAKNLNNSASYYDHDAKKLGDAEVEFILDTTDPIITDLNVSQGQMYEASDDAYELSFTVTDNIGIREVVATLDGEEHVVKPDASGFCSLTVPAKSWTSRTVDIVARDLANRTATLSDGPVEFRVTSDFVELHLPPVIGTAVAAAGGGTWLALRWRRRDKEA